MALSMLRSFVLLASLLALSGAVAAEPLPSPAALQAYVIDNYFGNRVADPYRPREEPDPPHTKAWVASENALTLG